MNTASAWTQNQTYPHVIDFMMADGRVYGKKGSDEHFNRATIMWALIKTMEKMSLA